MSVPTHLRLSSMFQAHDCGLTSCRLKAAIIILGRSPCVLIRTAISTGSISAMPSFLPRRLTCTSVRTMAPSHQLNACILDPEASVPVHLHHKSSVQSPAQHTTNTITIIRKSQSRGSGHPRFDNDVRYMAFCGWHDGVQRVNPTARCCTWPSPRAL